MLMGLHNIDMVIKNKAKGGSRWCGAGHIAGVARRAAAAVSFHSEYSGRAPRTTSVHLAFRTASEAVIAQLAARRSHNPKVVSSILTRRTFAMSPPHNLHEWVRPERFELPTL